MIFNINLQEAGVNLNLGVKMLDAVAEKLLPVMEKLGSYRKIVEKSSSLIRISRSIISKPYVTRITYDYH